jgi:hypothetical protein
MSTEFTLYPFRGRGQGEGALGIERRVLNSLSSPAAPPPHPNPLPLKGAREDFR